MLAMQIHKLAVLKGVKKDQLSTRLIDLVEVNNNAGVNERMISEQCERQRETGNDGAPSKAYSKCGTFSSYYICTEEFLYLAVVLRNDKQHRHRE